MGGNLVSILTKPIDFLKMIFFRYNVGAFLMGLLGIVIYYFVGYFMKLYLLTDMLWLVLFFTSYILAVSIAYGIGALVGIVSLWTGESNSIMRLISTFRGLLSGEMLPLTMLPDTLFLINSFLPFKYMMFVPIFIFMKQFTLVEALKEISFQILMFIVLITITRFLYNKGIKKYEGYGG